MVRDLDIVAGLRALWDSDATLDGLIPVARVYKDRIAEQKAWPAAAIRVTETDYQRFGSDYYTKTFEAEVIVEMVVGVVEPETIADAVIDALAGNEANDYTAGLTVTGGTVSHCIEKPGGRTLAQNFRLDGQDMLRVNLLLEIKVHGED